MTGPAGYIIRMRDDRTGAGAIEFAIAFPVLMLLIMGIIEFSLALFAQSLLEGAVSEASRFGLTGGTVGTQTREESIRDIVEERTMGFLDMEQLDIETLVYPTFDSIGEAEPYTDENANDAYDSGEPFEDINGNGTWDADMGLSGAGGPDDIVLYRLSYPWRAITGFMAERLGEMNLQASVAIRNEPF